MIVYLKCNCGPNCQVREPVDIDEAMNQLSDLQFDYDELQGEFQILARAHARATLKLIKLGKL